ncbi:DUF420 domain-containing protein [Fictibacillus phosphorivorans]|uniref:DUF420 domain-containing protein n=1 Tax=Fictibacillus phosphorivorans TaxID=1221500 RepID=UPI001293BCD8|nr:DUF420 domain-containing protein [Fictibacillus phosphorivorans]MQR94087.1 DUF420 domain-containing protein [Fictibacillus phosphorivorans]
MAETKQRNYTPLIIGLSIAINVLVAVLFFLPEYEGEIAFDVRLLPRLNAIFNSFTFVFLLAALYFVKQKNITLHKRFILAAFTSTTFFLLSYVTYHYLTESTSYGGEGPLKYVYFFILITHILLAIVIVPLALITVTRGFNMQVEKHRKIARWTMPLWLYVSLTGVIVYLMIAPYYS